MFTQIESNKKFKIKYTKDDGEEVNVTWTASKEGPLSLVVESVIVSYTDNSTEYTANSTENFTITLNRFIEIESADSFTKSEGSWTALLAIFVLMSLCSYIIYTGMEDESEVIDSESSEEEVEDDEDLREMAIPQETDDEKEN